jgi:hypothetical protein
MASMSTAVPGKHRQTNRHAHFLRGEGERLPVPAKWLLVRTLPLKKDQLHQRFPPPVVSMIPRRIGQSQRWSHQCTSISISPTKDRPTLVNVPRWWLHVLYGVLNSCCCEQKYVHTVLEPLPSILTCNLMQGILVHVCLSSSYTSKTRTRPNSLQVA